MARRHSRPLAHGTTMDDTRYTTAPGGVRVPQIIYGTAWKKAATADCVAAALRCGFRGIDTAGQPKHYDEAGVGAGIAAALGADLRRSDLYLQSKFTPLSGQDPQHLPYDPEAPLAEQVAQSLQSSLRNLRTDYLDCLVLHSPLTEAAQLQQVWRAMEAACAAGQVRQLGISNCYDCNYLEVLYRWAHIKPAVVQNRFYAQTGYDREIRGFCRREGVLYQSFWTLTANPHLLLHPAVTTAATRHARTPEQVLFRYLTQEGVVPLTGTRSAQHMRDDLDIFAFALTEAERAAITALL